MAHGESALTPVRTQLRFKNPSALGHAEHEWVRYADGMIHSLFFRVCGLVLLYSSRWGRFVSPPPVLQTSRRIPFGQLAHDFGYSPKEGQARPFMYQRALPPSLPLLCLRVLNDPPPSSLAPAVLGEP